MDSSPPGSSVRGILQARILDWSGLPFPSPKDLPDSEIEPGSPGLQADSLPSESPGKPSHMYNLQTKSGKSDRLYFSGLQNHCGW